MARFTFDLGDTGAALVLEADAVERLISDLRAKGFLDVGGTSEPVAGPDSPPDRGTPTRYAGGQGRIVLGATDPRWERHSGGQRWHSGPNWTAGDEALAERTYANISEKVRHFSDLLVDRPGEVFTVPDIIKELPTIYTSDRSIAGSLNGYRLPCEAAGRQFPFRWWEANPTEYAMHPSVAKVWREGRRRWLARQGQ